MVVAIIALLGACPVFAQPAGSAVPPPAERKVALVIGNGNYAYAGPLANPIADAALIAESLRKVGFSDITVAQDLGRANFERALRSFRDQARGAKVAMIYYAGHGVEEAGHNWLIPVDAVLDTSLDLAYEAVDLDRVMEAVAGAQVRLVVLDACRNSPFMRRWARTQRGIMRGLGEIQVDDYLVIFAASPGQTASDGSGGNSPFAISLARRLQQVDLPVQLLGNAVRDDVLSATGGIQRPFVSASISASLVYLAPRPQSPTGDPVLGIDFAALDALAWRGALKANSREAFEDYRTQFPQGRFARLAEQNIRRLSSAIPRVLATPPPAPAAPPRADAPQTFAVLASLPRVDFAAPAAPPRGEGGPDPAAPADAAPLTPEQQAERQKVAMLNLGIQAHNDAILDQNRIAREKYQAEVAAVEAAVVRQREEYQRKLEIFAAEESRWRDRVRACETGDAKSCGRVADAGSAPPPPRAPAGPDQVLAWPEGVVVCSIATDPTEQDSRCFGPSGPVAGRVGTRDGDRAIEKACDAKQGIRDLGAIGAFHVYGCGFGVHPEKPQDQAHGNADAAVRFGLTAIPGRATFHCARRTAAMCRAM